MKPKKPGLLILGYLALALTAVACMVAGVLIVSTDGFLSYEYAPHRNLIGISLLVLAMVFLVAQVKFMLWGMQWMASNLDTLFVPLGLQAEKHSLNGRHYFGKIRSRRIDIYCKPVNNRRYHGDVKTVKYIGHTFNIYCAGQFNTRGSIGRIRDGDGIQDKIRLKMVKYISKKLIEKFGGEIIKINDNRYEDFDIYALDPEWMLGFLNNEDVGNALATLLSDEIKCARQHVHVIPEAIHLTTMTNVGYLRPEIMKRAVECVLDISTTAESLPAAAITSEGTEAERKARMGKSAA
jgi:hypothetical protein